jgi:hypothetical protein
LRSTVNFESRGIPVRYHYDCGDCLLRCRRSMNRHGSIGI